MKAVLLRSHGGVENLDYADVPDPEPGPGEVRVRVEACAVNHLDVWTRKGLPHVKLPLPHVLGADVAGSVSAVGAGVRGVHEGDAVVVNPGVSCGRCRRCLAGADNLCRHYSLLGEHRWGGYAEQVVVPAANILARPASLGAVEAAALPVTFLTAWQMLVERARVRMGETVLVWAAGSGVGVAAVQIAKLHGATVVATVGAAAKVERARALGADHVLNHATDDVVASVKRLTDRRGADVVFEHVGAATWERSLLAAAWGGRIVTCGATSGYAATTDLRHVFFRQVQVLGSTMGSKSSLYDIVDLAAAGRLRPIIDSRLPLRDAARAHERIEARDVFGKVVLLPAA